MEGTFSIAERTYALQDANFNVTTFINRISTAIGDVDASDMDIWFTHLQVSAPGGGIIADFDHSGLVDAADYDIWYTHLGTTGTAS